MGINYRLEDAKLNLMDAACEKGFDSEEFKKAHENYWAVFEEEFKNDEGAWSWVELEDPSEYIGESLLNGDEPDANLRTALEDLIKYGEVTGYKVDENLIKITKQYLAGEITEVKYEDICRN